MACDDEYAAGSNYAYKNNFRTALPQFLAVSVKNLLLLGYGMTMGFTTILIPAVENPKDGEILHLEKTEISWISSMNLIVVPLGCALSGIVMSPIGRRRAMQIVNLPFCIAWLMFHYSSRTEHLYGALFLTGLAGGLLEAPVLTYVAEITQPHLRGMLTATSSMCITIGVFTQFLFGLFLYWRTIALINIIFTVLAVIALCFVPESPHWLISKRRHDDARKSLQWLRGWISPHEVEQELKDIQLLYKKGKDAEEVEETLREKFTHYFKRSFLIPFFLIAYAFFVGHFSGMTTLQTYAVSIFNKLEAPIDKYYATLILGILQILGSGACVLLVHYTGKRPLTLFSTLGAGICCLLVAGYDYYIRNHDIVQETLAASSVALSNNETTENSVENVVKNPYSWIPTTLLMLLALITHTGIRLLPWILIGEELLVRIEKSHTTYTGDFHTMLQFPSPIFLLVLWAYMGGGDHIPSGDPLARLPAYAIKILAVIGTAHGQIFNSKTRSGGAGLASAIGYIFGFLTNKMYISMVDTLFIWGTYGIYSIVSFSGCIIFFIMLPETEGKKLNDIENHFAGITKLTNSVYRSKKRPFTETTKMQNMKGTANPTFEDDTIKT